MTVDVTEYQNLGMDANGARVAVGMEPARAVQQITEGGASVSCGADFQDSTRFVRIHTPVAIRIAFGKTPTAAATSQRMAAGSTEFFGVTPGLRVAVITTA
jgi:hypothetical protein